MNNDLISRQAVLDVLKDKWNMFSDANDAMQESIDTIESLPSGSSSENPNTCEDDKPCTECPKYDHEKHNCPHFCHVIKGVLKEQPNKLGMWIERFDESGKWYECDQCHTDWGGAVNYCPNCGAKMSEIPTGSEARARWICCPMCDKKKCERETDDCDVKIYLRDKAEGSGE